MKKVNKAVILAAGRGTRFLPYTKATPKEMLPIVDTPCLDIIVDEVVEAGISEIMLIISPEKESIRKHFSRDQAYEDFLAQNGKEDMRKIVESIANKAKFSYAYQEVANGSGSALLLAEEFAAGQPVAVLNGDDLMYSPNNSVTKQMVEAYEQVGESVLGVQKVQQSQISKYGSISIKEEVSDSIFKIDNVVEKPETHLAPSLYAALGRYVVDAKVFQILKRTPRGKNGELGFTDALNIQANEQGIFAKHFEGKRYDTGDKLGYVKSVVEFALRHEEIGSQFGDYLKEFCKDLK